MTQEQIRTLVRAGAGIGLGLGYMLMGLMLVIVILPRGGMGIKVAAPMLMVLYGFGLVGLNGWIITRTLRAP